MQEQATSMSHAAESEQGATFSEVVIVAGWTLTATLFAFALGGIVVFYMI
jgi:hypothetical protein